MATTTLKVSWDDDTISMVRIACLVVAEVYESKGHLPGDWNLKDAQRLRQAAQDISCYVEARDQAKQDQAVQALVGEGHGQG